jgi:hypothetical protein
VRNPTKHRPHIADADYYRLGYQLAAQLLNRAAIPLAADVETGAPQVVNDDPLAVAEQLLADARAVLAWYDARSASWMRWRRPAPQEERLRTFLAETIVPCCALVAARRLYQLDRRGPALLFVADVLRRASRGALSYRAYYALACLEANTGAVAAALGHLLRALHDAPRNRRAELAQWAESDPAFQALRGEVRSIVEQVGAR